MATVGSKNILLTGSGRGSHVPHSRIKNKEETREMKLCQKFTFVKNKLYFHIVKIVNEVCKKIQKEVNN